MASVYGSCIGSVRAAAAAAREERALSFSAAVPKRWPSPLNFCLEQQHPIFTVDAIFGAAALSRLRGFSGRCNARAGKILKGRRGEGRENSNENILPLTSYIIHHRSSKVKSARAGAAVGCASVPKTAEPYQYFKTRQCQQYLRGRNQLDLTDVN